MIEIKINPEESRVEAIDDGKIIGLCEYKIKGHVLDVYHTEVDSAYGGRGLAKKLLDQVVAYARAENKKIYPTCSYVEKKFDEDRHYRDVDAR
ncbi:GNAT family N-acetyltransferase [uncultured Anaerococcus sp.]|uniref:GNAT family N-acetyltransferase n=1 Tax=uncultured Anaerococcus sp. TaxID=293428 RepID=UPI00288A6EF4|nr:GNAT family N-acetyltransferase [uncultured Anaerococcus sp.]